MELKRINPNGEIFLRSILNHVEFFFKLEKFHSEMNPTSYFFKKML